MDPTHNNQNSPRALKKGGGRFKSPHRYCYLYTIEWRCCDIDIAYSNLSLLFDTDKSNVIPSWNVQVLQQFEWKTVNHDCG